MALALDHLVIAVRDLAAAEENYTRLLGRKPSWRGKHPTYGTANVLYRLDNSYMELLALGEGDSPWATALRNHLDRHGEGLYAIALGTHDIDATVAAARANGLDVQDAAAGNGVDETTGARREWRNARIDPAATRGVRAFFIQHLSPPDVLPMSEPVAAGGAIVTGVDHTVIISSDLAATLALWTSAIGLELRRTVDFSSDRRLHFLRLGHSILELAGASERTGAASDKRPATSDLLWGVSYRVDSAAAQVERLRAAGVDVSDARTGRAGATVVADLKPGFSHDVRTLFIEK